MEDIDKNKQSNDNESVYDIEYHFSHLKLVRINKALESLITVSICKYDEIGIDRDSIYALHDFKNCLCEAISEHMISLDSPEPIDEPFLLLTNKKQYQEFD
jgi:hypothetical protein